MRTLILICRDWEKYCQFNFDIFGLMLFYSKELDEAKSLDLYRAMATQYFYKLLREMPLGGLTSEDESVAITVLELPTVIDFIDTQVIPTLNTEGQNIIMKYGGVESFINFFTKEKGFTEDIFLYDDDFQENDSDIYTKENLIHCFNMLKDFLQYVLENGLPSYEVRVDI